MLDRHVHYNHMHVGSREVCMAAQSSRGRGQYRKRGGEYSGLKEGTVQRGTEWDSTKGTAKGKYSGFIGRRSTEGYRMGQCKRYGKGEV